MNRHGHSPSGLSNTLTFSNFELAGDPFATTTSPYGSGSTVFFGLCFWIRLVSAVGLGTA